MTALLCHSVTVMDVTMMAPLCQRCHHNGCHRRGAAGPTLSPQWVSLWQRRCANAVTMMDVTVTAPLCLQCHHDGATAMALLYQHCHCNGCHHGSPAVPTLSP